MPFWMGGLSTVQESNIADGAVTNAKIAALAAIAYSKLNLALSIVNADIAAAAAIAGTKLEPGWQKNVAGGILGLDANQKVPYANDAFILPLPLRYTGFYSGTWVDFSVVAGTWVQSGTQSSQTNWDNSWVGSPSTRYNSSVADLDEIASVSELALCEGTYEIKIVSQKNTNCGVLEVLLGTTSLGTSDLYAASVAYNNVVTITYSPTTRVYGLFRIRANGKNASSSAYAIPISRIQIRKTA